jgi:hypothetical protein
MSFQATSFLIGLGAGWALPVLTRILRPLVVEATVAGMAAFEEGRRIVAEQMEIMEDIAAEAKARRDGTLEQSSDEGAEDVEAATRDRARRRGPSGGRRRAS